MPIRAKSEGASETLKLVGMRLRAVRSLAEVGQEELCERLGIDQSTYSKWEHGKRVPDVLVLVAFARRFKTSLDFLFRGLPGEMHPDLTRLLRMRNPDLFAEEPGSTAQDTGTALASYKASIALSPTD